ncbi:unnamed protein product [Cuscuta campestris]|nr:unnamed protein product [Cuscuta campestris]
MTKRARGADCSGVCSPFESPPCGSTDCRCIPWGLFVGQCVYPSGVDERQRRMAEEHPNLCQSDEECMKKGSGDLCARYPNPDIEYGWCINSVASAASNVPLNAAPFLKMPAASV